MPAPALAPSGFVPPTPSGGRHLAIARHTGVCAIDHEGDVWCAPFDEDHLSFYAGLARMPELGPALDLASDDERLCAIGRDGRVRCRGEDGTALVEGIEGARSGLVVDGLGVAALAADGTVLAQRIDGQRTWPPLPAAADVVADGSALCFAAPTGDVSCMGAIMMGGLEVPRDVLTPIPGLGHATAIRGTREALCALDDRGIVRCFGQNAGGQIGSSHARDVGPLVPEDLPPVRAIAQSFIHTCAIDLHDAVWCWGAVDYYAAADGPAMGSRPYRLEALGRASEIAVAPYVVCALDATDGGLACARVGRDGTADPVAPEVTHAPRT